MKKLFFTLCALCLCGTMWAVSDRNDKYDTSRPTDENEIYVDQQTGLYFYVSSENAVITYKNSADDEDNPVGNSSTWTSGYDIETLSIPEQVSADGSTYYSVTKIGAYAFFHATSIVGELIIPGYITDLGIGCFEGCTGLTSVTLAYSETGLQEKNSQATANSFYGCSSIKTVYLNRDVNDGRSSSASNYAYLDAPFSYLTSIETIYVGEEVTKIPYNMFNCNGSTSCALTTVYCYATNHVPSLDFRSFGQHTGLTLYVYDELVETFKADHQTYTDNYSNTSGGWGDIFNVTGMGSMPTTLEDGTYKDVATGLYFEVDEKGVISIYHDEAGVYTDANLVVYSYDEEGNPNAYTLPSTVDDGDGHSGNVTRIEAGAFEDSSISGHIVIPAFITDIGENAFTSSTSITEVTYEYSATPLADENQCTAGNMTGGSFHSCTGIITVNLYRDISYATSAQQPGAFVGLSNITTLNIGPRVTTIHQYMFRNGNSATKLATINCYAAVPPTLGTGALGVLPTGYVINVPQGSEETYASYWSDNASNLSTLSNAYAVGISLSNENGYYATYYNSKAVDIYPQGGTTNDVTTYAASGVDVEEDDAFIVLSEVGATVPAGVAVLVEATAEGTYTVIETTAAQSASYTGTNNLYGYDEDTTITAPDSGDYYYYTLSTYNDVLGFWWHESNGGAFTSAAHKAYLALEQGTLTGTKSIKLKKGEGGDETTGISSVEVENEATAVKGIYTLQGVRVNDMNQKGVYIVDGRKVLVK